MNPELKTFLEEKRGLVDSFLEGWLPRAEGPLSEVVEAMRYSLFAGGKRLRPILCLAAAQTVGGSEKDALPAACALELIHTYSLIHDDLPAMDDDDLRRGKPSSHKVFGEAQAILAGDALLTEAFSLLAELPENIEAQRALRVIKIVSRAAGYRGMVGGQHLDLWLETQKHVSRDTLESTHSLKTGALISASLEAGAVLGGGGEAEIETLKRYGQKVGLAFQVADDILDVVGTTEELGKPAGSDEAGGKATYPAIMGLSESRNLALRLVQEAVEELKIFADRAEPLRGLALYIVERTN